MKNNIWWACVACLICGCSTVVRVPVSTTTKGETKVTSFAALRISSNAKNLTYSYTCGSANVSLSMGEIDNATPTLASVEHTKEVVSLGRYIAGVWAWVRTAAIQASTLISGDRAKTERLAISEGAKTERLVNDNQTSVSLAEIAAGE